MENLKVLFPVEEHKTTEFDKALSRVNVSFTVSQGNIPGYIDYMIHYREPFVLITLGMHFGQELTIRSFGRNKK